MLISITHSVGARRTFTRALLTVVALAAGVILGLLAMHSLNSHATAAGHGDTVVVGHGGTVVVGHSDVAHSETVVGTADGADGEVTAASAGAPGLPSETACATCSDGHDMAWTACVLALLVAIVLLARPAAWWRKVRQVLDRRGRALRSFLDARDTLDPPSLTVLCISRT